MAAIRPGVVLLLYLATRVAAQSAEPDTLGLKNGYTPYQTRNFSLELVRDSQTLASLIPKDVPGFDFLPNTTLQAYRAANGQHQTGDLLFRYRALGDDAWISQDTAAARKPVESIAHPSSGSFASASLDPTLKNSLINVTRTWSDVDGDLALSFTLTNIHDLSLELGALGFPITSDSIFTNRTAVDINANCSLIDPNIALDAGYLRVTRIDGEGPAVVVTPLNDATPFEGWGFLHENTTAEAAIGYQTESFEGYYQWMTRTLAYVEGEWNASQPWNTPTSSTLKPGENVTIGVRFTIVDEIQNIEDVVASLGIPVAKGIPGYVIPEDLDAQLLLTADCHVSSLHTQPANAFEVKEISEGIYTLIPQPGVFGRVLLTVVYGDGRRQTVNYHVSKSAPVAVQQVGQFLNDRHWWSNASDPFGRSPSFMCVDHSDGIGEVVIQDYLARVWLSGECHEAGASWYTMALKQVAQADAEQVSKLETFVHEVMWKTIQLPTYAVRQSIFWYDPNITDYFYDPNLPWWPETTTNYSVSWSKPVADVTTRSYGYTYPATAYWALYRVGRTFPSMLKQESWEWYLSQAYQTLVYCFKETNGTHLQPLWDDGLMGETAFGELLKDLYREGKEPEAHHLESLMKARADVWASIAIPYGSEIGWDCTGEEGVYYWSQYFGDSATVNKTIRTITGYDPVVAHWAYNGNARRYWDFQFDGKIDRIERQVHHYGSALNALPILEHIRTFPDQATPYLYRLAFGGQFAPLTNVHQDGFASTAFHSWPETLAWDNYTGDYGPAFAGLVLGSACYVTVDPEYGLLAYGGTVQKSDDGCSTVLPRDALRRRLYIQPLDLFLELDAGAIENVHVDGNSVTLQIGEAPALGVTPAAQAILWVNQSFYVNNTAEGWEVFGNGVSQKRGGWSVSLGAAMTEIQVKKK